MIDFKFNKDDISLFSQAGAFGMWRAWRSAGLDSTQATYDVIVRDMPNQRNFLIFSGLEEAIFDILNWKFSSEDIALLESACLIDTKMATELRNYKFTGDIWAMKEGSVFFPGEPIMRLSGPLWQLELLYLYVVNVISSNTTFSSKCVRSILSAKGKAVIMPATRAQAFESGFKCMRALYIVGGNPSTSQLSFWRKYNVKMPSKPLNALTHAFIKSFDSEIQAMRVFGNTFPDKNAAVLVDTYDFEQGVKNFITVHNELKEQGGGFAMLYIDSGNLTHRSNYARKQLDIQGLTDVKILVSGNIEEYAIKKMVEKNAACDAFLLITELISSPDAPKLEVVYKLAELQSGRKKRQVMKLSKNKVSYPGKKQVVRVYTKKGIMRKDSIILDHEKTQGIKLLKKIITKGKLISPLPSLNETRAFCQKEIKSLPHSLTKFTKQIYPVSHSVQLKQLTQKIKNNILSYGK